MLNFRQLTARLLGLVAILVAFGPGRTASAQLLLDKPTKIANVGVDEHLNAILPLDARFLDERGMPHTLKSFFPGDRPIILSLNYSNCPKLCSVQLSGLVSTLKKIDLEPGQDFDLISVSVDPNEPPSRARETRDRYVNMYGRTAKTDGWHFLTGDKLSITRLAQTVGFRYELDAQTGEFNHAAVFMICTPEGRISRYIYGVSFPDSTVRLSLVEAGQGEIGTTLDHVLLYCFSYDPDSNSYAPVAINIMKISGGATVLMLACLLVPFWIRRPTKEKKTIEPAEEEKTSAKVTPGSECWHV